MNLGVKRDPASGYRASAVAHGRVSVAHPTGGGRRSGRGETAPPPCGGVSETWQGSSPSSGTVTSVTQRVDRRSNSRPGVRKRGHHAAARPHTGERTGRRSARRSRAGAGTEPRGVGALAGGAGAEAGRGRAGTPVARTAPPRRLIADGEVQGVLQERDRPATAWAAPSAQQHDRQRRAPRRSPCR